MTFAAHYVVSNDWNILITPLETANVENTKDGWAIYLSFLSLKFLSGGFFKSFPSQLVKSWIFIKDTLFSCANTVLKNS